MCAVVCVRARSLEFALTLKLTLKLTFAQAMCRVALYNRSPWSSKMHDGNTKCYIVCNFLSIVSVTQTDSSPSYSSISITPFHFSSLSFGIPFHSVYLLLLLLLANLFSLCAVRTMNVC